MSTHPRAKLGLAARHELCTAIESGESIRGTARTFNVSPATAHKHRRRWRAASDAERRSLACLRDRSSRPRRSPSELAAREQDRTCEVRERTGWGPRLIASEVGHPHSTVHRTLQRHGCSRRARAPRTPVVRYEWPCPGNLLHMDTKRCERFAAPGHAGHGDRRRRNRGAGHEYVHSIVDDCSRLAYRRSTTTSAPTRWPSSPAGRSTGSPSGGIVAERILTDNAWIYTKNKRLAELLDRRQILHKRTRPYSPRTNGKVERHQQTLEREWEKGLAYNSSADRRAALPHWVSHYNTRRRHSGIGDRTPMQRVHDVLGQDS